MADNPRTLDNVLAAMTAAGKLDAGDKRWIREQLEIERKHQRNMAIIKACGDNSDLPFVLMFLGGSLGIAASALANKIIEKLKTNTDDPKKNETQIKEMTRQLAEMMDKYTDFQALMMGGLGGYLVGDALKDQLGDAFTGNRSPKTWVEYANATVMSVSAGSAAFAASILTLRAIFGNSDKDGGMASLVGLGI